MRSTLMLLAATVALAAVACGPSTPTPTGPDAASDPRCPEPDAPCMNPDNHAACLEVAASCEGDIAVLESCPAQFACERS
ncbi:MAG: hypothetical protein AAGN82_30775 [Myxococcota bacterium]